MPKLNQYTDSLSFVSFSDGKVLATIDIDIRTAVLAGVCLIIGHFVSASSSTFAQLVSGRVITGIGMSPYECLSGAIFADVYFVVGGLAEIAHKYHKWLS